MIHNREEPMNGAYQRMLHVKDELNLYLVSHGLKPASEVDIWTYPPEMSDEITISKEKRAGVLYQTRHLSSSAISSFISLIHNTGLPNLTWEGRSHKETYSPEGRLTQVDTREIYAALVGKTSSCRDTLENAQTPIEKGLAYGFPPNAVYAYLKVIDGERRDDSFVQVSLAKAKRAGIEKPSWLAYVSFIPEQLDFVNQVVSVSSEKLGRRYQQYVRSHNPDLAMRVEKHFQDRKLPQRWSKLPDQSYSLSFDVDTSSP